MALDTVLDIIFPTTIGIFFTYVLIRCWMGSKYKFVYLVGGLITIDSICSMINNSLIIYSERQLGNTGPPYFEGWKAWIPKVFLSFSNVTFALAIYIVAWQYHRIAHEIPLVMKGQPLPENACFSNKT